jgi:phosphatidate cytidylyltransferase
MGIAAAMVALPLLWPVLAGRATTALHDWTLIAMGALYVGWLGSHAVLLRELPDGLDWVLLALFSVWITDSAAYFVGRAIGRRKLAPSISPNKTWEGAVAGLIGGAVAVVALHEAFGLDASAVELVALAVVLPVIGQLGDLGESALKRSWGVKDTGWLLPGHGGFLDRIDSLLIVVPVVYYWVRWLVM